MIRNRFLSTLSLFLAFNAMATGAQARASQHRKHPVVTVPHNENNPRHAAIALQADTGQILFESHAARALYPASTTKIMTTYLLFQALADGKLSLDQTVDVSPYAASMPPTNLGLTERVKEADGSYGTKQVVTKIKVEDALRGMLCHSANDAAVVMAEAVAGSVDTFVARMNDTAKKLGMQNTTFINPNGLPGEGQHTTVQDMAVLANAVMRDFPQYYKFFDTKTFTYRGTTYHNTNHLLGHYTGMDGLKTGWIGASGYNLVASAKRGNVRVIGVVFGAPTSASRNAEMRRILDKGFAKLKTAPDQKIAKARYVPLPEPVWDTPVLNVKATIDDATVLPLQSFRTAKPLFDSEKGTGVSNGFTLSAARFYGSRKNPLPKKSPRQHAVTPVFDFTPRRRLATTRNAPSL